MFEEITVEGIKQDILERIDLDMSKEPGSFLYNLVSGISFRIWSTYQSMNALIPIAYVDETSGEYLEKRCREVGIIRKTGRKAELVLHFTGGEGVVISKGTVFLTANALGFALMDEVVLDANGEGSGNAEAMEVGEKYNIEAGRITGMYVNLSGLNTYTNDAASGGEDAETDEELYGRLVQYWQMPATSGNVNEYQAWALSVDGVGYAKVIPTWDGPGTVKVVIADPDKRCADAATVERCAGYIEGVRPIGAAVTIVGATEKPIDVSARVQLDPEMTAEEVQLSFREKLEEYISDFAFQQSVFYYHRAAFLLLSVEGVLDFSELTVNEGRENVLFSDTEIPVLGNVEVNVVE